MTRILEQYYPDIEANDNAAKVKLHWIDWSIPPQVEIIKPRLR